MGFFNLFGSSGSKIEAYLDKGAVVLDVRTKPEYEEGHVKGSKHIVLDDLMNHIDEIKSWNKPVITCCRSGARSGNAENLLVSSGIDAINGGPWQNVDQYTK